MIVYVVTNPESGWDCVVGVFTNKEYVYNSYYKKHNFVIHTQNLCEDVLEDSLLYLKKQGRTDVQYVVKDYDYTNHFLIEDSFNYTIGKDISEENSKEIVSLILDWFSIWASKNNIKYDNLYLSTPSESDDQYDNNYACMCDGMSEEDAKYMNDTGIELFEKFLKGFGIYNHG